MIPVLDLKAQYESIKDEIDAAIAEVLESTHLILGLAVRELEQKVAAYCGGAGAQGSRGAEVIQNHEELDVYQMAC
ncbi:MAG: DegT/DnrJ/EryC1/StrS aminotransferase family protein [Deltaproteobacteria bacterium]|nr:DegT/DnrJ/EryC1/StrS aminotransferase family protein [Deltaproteobacteria bacterium]